MLNVDLIIGAQIAETKGRLHVALAMVANL